MPARGSGNHDEYLRRFCDMQLGDIMVTREAVHRTVAGRPAGPRSSDWW